MYFQRAVRAGVSVWKTTSMVCGVSMANRLLVESGDSGAGARASSRALVRVKTVISVDRTMTLRWVFFTSALPEL